MSNTPQTEPVSDFMERHFAHLRKGRKEYTEAEVRSIMLAMEANMRTIDEDREALREELRRLDAENQQLREQLDQAVQQYKEDAERYRWLRDDTDSDWAICEWSHDPGDEGYYRDARAPHIVDAAIDAAMAQGVKG